jgi:formylglycine-generating enzyme required for sulfatase activity
MGRWDRWGRRAPLWDAEDRVRRFAALILALALTAPANAAPGDEIYTRPGTLLDGGDGARVSVYCLGSGSPTVVFESGFSDWAPAWAVVQPRIAEFTRACSYDRAGSGFSDPGPVPRTTERIATELHTALRSGGIAGPYILVGAAFGGDHVRAFADLFPQDVVGLVLIDADASDVDTPENRKSDDEGIVSYVPKFRQCRDAIAAGKTDFALPPPPGRPPRPCAQGFFRGLPEPEWSDALNATILDLARHKVAMWDADISEMEQMPADEVWLQQHRRTLGSTPVRILTSGNHGVGHLDRPPAMSLAHLKYEYDRALAQSRWLGLSSDAQQIFVTNSSEYIQFDQPDVVVDTVREVYYKMHRGGAPADGTFRECPECPEMVVIPAGRFRMGSSAAEKRWAASHGVTMAAVADEAPQHEAFVPSFAMGKYDVTRGEYAAFVRETKYLAGDGCGRDSYKWEKRPELTWEHPGFEQTDRDPVVCVSWRDAKAYIAWLNGKVRPKPSASGDGPYRLPSESEWEYAARAGASTRFYWGDDDAAASGHAWYKANSGARTHPVGLKPANAFGLYDMVGNVWQWTEDCYLASYSSVPTDGGAAEAGVPDPRPDGTHQCMRVDRGASWFFQPWALRSATRERNPDDYRDAYMGFRVARTPR